MNNVILTGYISTEVELKSTQNGTPVTSFNIAVKRDFKENGEYKTDFFRVICWNKLAEHISRFFHKGSGAEICGRLQTRIWTDNNGKKCSVVEIVANTVDFPKSNGTQNSTPASLATDYEFEEIENNEDLPF